MQKDHRKPVTQPPAYPKPRFDNNLNTGRGHAGRNWTKSFLKFSLIHIPNPLLSEKDLKVESCLQIETKSD